ncbi:CPBP family intramembrane glutamic endopeptidase [Candidatus Nitrosocosmicus sp. FF01]|uniref:CPBP family intramembrane glutamic endopeptidase n=1 Tax=Candidatus Nitrosocosmicus sp. FF01 TaxID=3397670 RepID=UPI0039EC6953
MSITNSLNRTIEKTKVALIFFMVIVTGISFGIGLYLVFFTNLGGEINWTDEVPLDFLLLGIFGFQTIYFNLGLTFLLFWFVYLTCYVYCFLKPISLRELPFLRARTHSDFVNTQIKQKDGNGTSVNYLMITLSWFSAYFVLSILIDIVQQIFGVKLGNPLTDNPLLSFFYLSTAPLNEEIFFRVILMGLPLFLIFVPLGKGQFLSTLNHPYLSIQHYKKKHTTFGIFIVIVLSSFVFGLSHVIFGGGYEIGKITQAALGGLIIGWVYYRYGLSSAITFHWISNYVFFAYSILGFYLFQTPWNTESDNVLLGMVSIGFIILGLLFLYQLSCRMLKKYVV